MYTECYVFERGEKRIVWTKEGEEEFENLQITALECRKKYNRNKDIIFITEVPKGVEGTAFTPKRSKFFQKLLKDPLSCPINKPLSKSRLIKVGFFLLYSLIFNH